MKTVSTLRKGSELNPEALFFLMRLAHKYIWWKITEEAMKFPDRITAQVMNIGIWEDSIALIETIGEDHLRNVLQNSEIGQFNPRSWHYWHYRLGLTQPGLTQVPAMPVRRLL